MVVMLAFFGMLNQIKLIAENQALANSLSLFSIGMNLVWNFFFFTVHFQLSIWGEYMQYLGLPAFWYFISSFTFESRLFIVVWRSQLTQQQMYDETYMRRRLTCFYVLFYLSSFGVALLQNWFLYDALPLILFNSTIWVPQIVKTFVERSRRGPPMQLALSFMALQSFLPLYLKLYRGNFLDHPTNILTGIGMLLLMLAQLVVMYLQQRLGPRWFVPKKWRLGPNEHNYFVDVPHARAGLTDEESGA